MKRTDVAENMRPALDALKAVAAIRRGGRGWNDKIWTNGVNHAEGVLLAALGLTVEQARDMLRGYRLPTDVAARVAEYEGRT